MLLLSLLFENPFLERRFRIASRFSGGLRANRIRGEGVEHIAPVGDLVQFLDREFQASPIADMQCRWAQGPRFEYSTRNTRDHEIILKMTAELFPHASISLSQESDPEIEDDDYFAILVETPGTVDEVVGLHREWHNRIGSVAPETASFYRLLLDINDQAN
jgi:hypothetical protein